MTCGICHKPIDDAEVTKAWKGVTGWVSPKGAKAMVGMQPNNTIAHPECIIRVRAKMLPAEQESLL